MRRGILQPLLLAALLMALPSGGTLWAQGPSVAPIGVGLHLYGGPSWAFGGFEMLESARPTWFNPKQVPVSI